MSDFVKREDAYRIALRYGGSIAGNKIAQLPAVDVSMDTIRAEHEAFRVASVRIAMLAKENAELKAQIPHWVSVEERLPKDYGDYLGYANGEVMFLLFNSDATDKWKWSACDAEGCFDVSVDEVTHWMPLPEPPQEAQE